MRGGGWKYSLSRALISVATDRAMGLAVLVWIGAAGLLVFPEYAELVPWIARRLIFIAALAFLCAGLLLPFAGPLLQRWRHRWVESLTEALNSYGANYRLAVQTLLMSFAIHLIQTWIQIPLGRAMGLDIPWAYCFIFFPLVDILSMLPVGFSGIGLREGGYFFFLSSLGIGPEKAIACGILWFVVMLANGLLGGVIFLLYERSGIASSPAQIP